MIFDHHNNKLRRAHALLHGTRPLLVVREVDFASSDNAPFDARRCTRHECCSATQCVELPCPHRDVKLVLQPELDITPNGRV